MCENLSVEDQVAAEFFAIPLVDRRKDLALRQGLDKASTQEWIIHLGVGSAPDKQDIPKKDFLKRLPANREGVSGPQSYGQSRPSIREGIDLQKYLAPLMVGDSRELNSAPSISRSDGLPFASGDDEQDADHE